MINRNNENGRSMVELMGYMGVTIAVVAGIGHLVANAFDNYKYSKAYIQLTDLAGGIVRAAAVDADYANVVSMVNDITNAEGQRIIPASFGRTANGLVNAFGGRVTISLPPETGVILDEGVMHDDGSVTHSDKFAISFEGLSRKQCIEMAMKDWDNNHNIDLYAIIINTNNYWYWPVYTQGSTDDNTLPVKRSAVTGTGSGDLGQCDQATDNVIMWLFN